MLLPVIHLKTLRRSSHPWVFRKMVAEPRFPLETGALVRVRDREGRDHGAAFWHPANTIALRMLDTAPGEDFDAPLVASRLAAAKKRRVDEWNLEAQGDSFRLVHAEADGLPALVVDKLGGVLVIQPHAAGWMHILPWVAEPLAQLFPGAAAAVLADPRVEAKEGVSFAALAAKWPPPPEAAVLENGLAYGIDFSRGHKTGFFLDQRPHRLRARGLAAGKTVLDLCCYTGGFALNAARGGAASVIGVDLDEDAIAQARRNLALNAERLASPGAVQFVHADAFDFLRGQPRRKTGMVVLDPPKLARHPGEVEAALARYADLNRLAAEAVADGGWLLTCSCSGAVRPERWLAAVRKAIRQTGRRMAEEPLAGPGPDHPPLERFPEGEYLKVLWGRIMAR